MNRLIEAQTVVYVEAPPALFLPKQPSFIVKDQIEMTRREFLRMLGLGAAGLTLAACVPSIGLDYPMRLPPAKSSEVPKPIPDNEFNGLSRNDKVRALLRGQMPESFRNLPIQDFVKRTIQLSQENIIPAVCEGYNLGILTQEVLDSMTIVTDANQVEDIVSKTLDKSDKNYQKAIFIIRQTPGSSFYNDKSKNKAYPKIIVINQAYLIDFWNKNLGKVDPSVLRLLLFREITDTIAHEETHALVEKREQISPEDNTQLMQLLGKTGIKVGNVTVYPAKFTNQLGVRLQYNDTNGGERILFEGVGEAFRMHYMSGLITEVTKLPWVSYTQYPLDTVSGLLMDNLAQSLNIDWHDLIKVNRERSFLGIVEFFRSKASAKNISLEQKDVMEIFQALDDSYFNTIDLDQHSQEITYKNAQPYWNKIADILYQKQKK